MMKAICAFLFVILVCSQAKARPNSGPNAVRDALRKLQDVQSVLAEYADYQDYQDYDYQARDLGGAPTRTCPTSWKDCNGCRGYLSTCCSDKNCAKGRRCKRGVWAYSCDN